MWVRTPCTLRGPCSHDRLDTGTAPPLRSQLRYPAHDNGRIKVSSSGDIPDSSPGVRYVGEDDAEGTTEIDVEDRRHCTQQSVSQTNKSYIHKHFSNIS